MRHKSLLDPRERLVLFRMEFDHLRGLDHTAQCAATTEDVLSSRAMIATLFGELRFLYGMLPPEVRKRAWMATSVERAA